MALGVSCIVNLHLMTGMRERMRAAGGSFELRPADGGGAEVVARAPNV